MNQQFGKKVTITVILGIALLFVYAMIFSFSADNAQESSKLSEGITAWVMEWFGKLTGEGKESSGVISEKEDSLLLEGMIRKMAHFAEYMLVGMLSFVILTLWMKKAKVAFWIVAVQLVLSGALDEFHQYFVPGRYAAVTDVLIDTAGGVAGILLILFGKGLKKLWNRIQKQK